MGLTRKQKANADLLKAALEKADAAKDSEALQAAREMGDAVKAGDMETLAELAAEAREKGWTE